MLLNDAVFVECAQALAKRVLTDSKVDTDAERVTRAFRHCLGREPSDAERDRLLRLLADFRELASADADAAAKLLGPHKPEGIAPAEAAAWVALSRTLLNLDEFVTRE
jgi:hypothetical protein